MPLNGRLISKRTIPGRGDAVSTTVIGWPIPART
jgi:hypothetical protein